jgi:hypothetical protein
MDARADACHVPELPKGDDDMTEFQQGAVIGLIIGAITMLALMLIWGGEPS